MKVKGQILICTAIMLNDHRNPYIESTTVLSDNNNKNIAVIPESQCRVVHTADSHNSYVFIVDYFKLPFAVWLYCMCSC